MFSKLSNISKYVLKENLAIAGVITAMLTVGTVAGMVVTRTSASSFHDAVTQPLVKNASKKQEAINIFTTNKDSKSSVSIHLNASDRDVLNAGDKISLKFDDKNVDVNKTFNDVVNQNNSLYKVTKSGSTIDLVLKKSLVNQANDMNFNVATKNVTATTKLAADINTAKLNLVSNKIQSTQKTVNQ